MMLFVEGRPVDALVGNQPESELRAFLDKHLPADESDPLVSAEEAFKEGLFEEALSGYLLALEQAPARAEALLGAARASLALGHVQEAMDYLKRVPEGDPLYETASRIQRLSSLSEFVGDEAALRAEAEEHNSAEAWHKLGATLALMGRFEEACEALLKVVMIDRGYRDDAGRVALLMIFDALGGEGEVVQRARHKLASLLF
jgi:putative thioredoxin